MTKAMTVGASTVGTGGLAGAKAAAVVAVATGRRSSGLACAPTEQAKSKAASRAATKCFMPYLLNPCPRPVKGSAKESTMATTTARKPKPRKPKPSPKPWAGRVTGIDLGLANTACVTIKGLLDEDVIDLQFIPTDPAHDLRQMNDDARRVRFIHENLGAYLALVQPEPGEEDHVIRYEWFAPRFNMKRGWTTSIVVGAVMATAEAHARRCARFDQRCEVIPSAPPLHVQLSKVPMGWEKHFTTRSTPHLLDALCHARLEWCKRQSAAGAL